LGDGFHAAIAAPALRPVNRARSTCHKPIAAMSLLSRIFALGVLLVTAGPLARCASLRIFAASSLSTALQEAAPVYAAAHGGDRIRLAFGASGTLARQIREGAPADVFISADETQIDRLLESGMLLRETRRALLANTLVVIVSAEGGPSLAALADLRGAAFRRLAIGDPATVPAGVYAREHLEKNGLWTHLSEKLLPVDSVRAALAAVESGNADAGFVYKTDALASHKVRIALEIPRAEGPCIVYVAAVVAGSKQGASAKAFLTWLASAEAQAIFLKHGFLSPGSD
jgi:molybdate transport system substrate-binding protein